MGIYSLHECCSRALSLCWWPCHWAWEQAHLPACTTPHSGVVIGCSQSMTCCSSWGLTNSWRRCPRAKHTHSSRGAGVKEKPRAGATAGNPVRPGEPDLVAGRYPRLEGRPMEKVHENTLRGVRHSWVWKGKVELSRRKLE